jgi:hypothetical protein
MISEGSNQIFIIFIKSHPKPLCSSLGLCFAWFQQLQGIRYPVRSLRSKIELSCKLEVAKCTLHKNKAPLQYTNILLSESGLYWNQIDGDYRIWNIKIKFIPYSMFLSLFGHPTALQNDPKMLNISFSVQAR